MVAVSAPMLAYDAACTSRSVSDSFCEDLCACIECSDADLTECQADGVDANANADELGCREEWDIYIECFAGELSCIDDEPVTAQCATEFAAYQACASDGEPTAPNGDACQQASQKISDKNAACGFSQPTTSEPTPCMSSEEAVLLTCLSECYVNAPCEVLNGTEISEEYTNCIFGC
jgi:hypothetical protein